MIAYCGIHCEECPSYIGTIKGDEALLIKMSEDYGNGKNDKIDFVCLGCKVSDVKLIATDCAGCAIRLCAMAKNKDFCATCDEFETCENIKPYRDDGTSIHAKRNAFIRAKYMRANGCFIHKEEFADLRKVNFFKPRYFEVTKKRQGNFTPCHFFL